MDKLRGILYSLPIMQSRSGKLASAALAVFLASLMVMHAGLGLAGVAPVPLPDKKPAIAISVPVPDAKPIANLGKNTHPEVKPVSVSAADIPLPKHKPAFIRRKIKISSTLSADEADLYREIFRLQSDGKMELADTKIASLNNGLLMGHVLAQRYLHPTATRASFEELVQWLKEYNHLPQAVRIYALAQKRKPDNYAGTIPEPEEQGYINGRLGAASHGGKKYKTYIQRTNAQSLEINALVRTIHRHVQQYEPTQALGLLNNDAAAQYMDSVEKDRVKAVIAAGYLYAGKQKEAQHYAEEALQSSGQYAPMAGWIAGLSYWQEGKYHKAARSFEVTATSPYSTGWMISASAYWASRAHMRAGNVQFVSQWLRLATSYPRTFYGLIATRALGQDFDFDWSAPSFSQADKNAIEQTPFGQRAKALIETGQLALAEKELKQLYKNAGTGLRKSLLAYAYYNRLPNLTFRLGNAVSKGNGGLYDSALYPIVPWEPQGGYKLDKALIHAFMRQESQFNVAAQSGSGATGLMQLMPATASHISGNDAFRDGKDLSRLRDPSYNLALGQKYINELLNHRGVGQDLLSLAVAYNAGPGKLAQWKKERSHINDPLLFIETIPYSETRAFVERVLSNYWIYSIQMRSPAPSLEAVAEGRWARYAQNENGVKFAEN